MPSIALILHLAEGHTGAVGSESLMKAIAWAKYLEGHAKRLYAPITGADFVSAKALARKLKSKALPLRFKQRDIYRKGWANLSTPDDVREALEILEDHNWVESHNLDHGSAGGRPAITYTVNPRIWEEAK